jgi:chloramphenicol O-acetyltransferase
MYDINGNLTVTTFMNLICTNKEDFFIIIFLFLWFMAVWNMMQYTVHWYSFILKLLEAEMAGVLTKTLVHCVGEVKII